MRKLKGGVHPKDNKNKSAASINEAKLPDAVVIPLAQHIGKPAKAVVKVGDTVKTGQLIGKADGFISANVHASISGKVKAVAFMPHPVFGVNVESVVIESDGKDEKYDNIYQLRNYNMFSAEEIRNMVFEAGIVGLGGATFPSHVKLSPPEDKKIKTVIINGAECEPYLTADHGVIMKRAKDLVDGLKIIMRAVNAKKGIIAIENNKPDCLSIMEKAVADVDNLSVCELAVRYPQGGEKQLIQVVLGKEVPSGGLPMDVGVVVQNVSTALAVYEAVVLGKPLYERVVTVCGGACKEPGNWKVRVGTKVKDLILQAGCYSQHPKKIILGGPMMGVAVPSVDIPLIKGSSGVLLLSKHEVATERERPCIRCGRCVKACTLGLMPMLLAKLSEKDKIEQLSENNIMDCLECGCCSYICPAKKPIVHLIKKGKAKLRAR